MWSQTISSVAWQYFFSFFLLFFRLQWQLTSFSAASFRPLMRDCRVSYWDKSCCLIAIVSADLSGIWHHESCQVSMSENEQWLLIFLCKICLCNNFMLWYQGSVSVSLIWAFCLLTRNLESFSSSPTPFHLHSRPLSTTSLYLQQTSLVSSSFRFSGRLLISLDSPFP